MQQRYARATMSDIEELARPIVEIREVVETFRLYKIALPGWVDTVSSAIVAFETSRREPSLAHVVAELRALLDVGLSSNAELIDQISAETASLLKFVTPPEIPGPEDDEWAFSLPATSA